MFIIYDLLDPKTFGIRYTGQTVQTLRERFRQHLCCNKKKLHSACWIKSLKNQGLKPIIREFYRTEDPDEADSIEISLIAYYRSLGYDLTNHDGGGQTNRIVSNETRNKQREAKLGHKHSPEHCVKISDALKGRKKTADYRRPQKKLIHFSCGSGSQKL